MPHTIFLCLWSLFTYPLHMNIVIDLAYTTNVYLMPGTFMFFAFHNKKLFNCGKEFRFFSVSRFLLLLHVYEDYRNRKIKKNGKQRRFSNVHYVYVRKNHAHLNFYVVCFFYSEGKILFSNRQAFKTKLLLFFFCCWFFFLHLSIFFSNSTTTTLYND